MSQKTIEVEHLSKVYGSTVAIKDVHRHSMQVRRCIVLVICLKYRHYIQT